MHVLCYVYEKFESFVLCHTIRSARRFRRQVNVNYRFKLHMIRRQINDKLRYAQKCLEAVIKYTLSFIVCRQKTASSSAYVTVGTNLILEQHILLHIQLGVTVMEDEIQKFTIIPRSGAVLLDRKE